MHFPGVNTSPMYKYAPCILAPQMASKLICVTLGLHGMADVIANRFPHAIFLQIPSLHRNLSVVDFANTAFGKPCPALVYKDDEGVTARDVHLIKHGQAIECMTNRRTAKEMSLPLTGNARIPKYQAKPEIYIRNLAILPGNDNLQDMFTSIKDGFYLEHGYGSEGSIEGEYACHVKSGYRVKDGKIGQSIKGYCVWGFALDFLRTISMISDDFSWHPHELFNLHGIEAAVGAPSIKACLNVGK